MRVLDYSAGLPGAAAIKNAGYGGAVRYIGFPRNRKCTNAGELRDFTNHGLGMALVFEEAAGNWRGGYAAGARDYRLGRLHADQIGFPRNRPIYMAVDEDVVTALEFRQAQEYIRGARDAAGGDPNLVGVYGEHDVCKIIDGYRGPNDERLCNFFWQCRAWSGTPVRLFGGRHLYQHAGYVTVGGVQCDYNDVLRDDWGQHLVEDKDMKLTDMVQLFDHETGAVKPYSYQDALFGTHFHAKESDIRAAQIQVVQAQILAAVTDSPDITPEFVETKMRESAIAAAEKQAPMVAALINGEISVLVERALEAVQDNDNPDEARQTVTELLRRISGLVPSVPQT